MEVLYFFVAVFGEVTYFSSPRMCLNLRALIFHRNIKKEGLEYFLKSVTNPLFCQTHFMVSNGS